MRLREGLHLVELQAKHVTLRGFQQSQFALFACEDRKEYT